MSALRVASQLAATWVAKLREVQTLLRNSPQHERVWYWQIQSNVLRYLILRYGQDPRLDCHRPIPAPPSPTAEFVSLRWNGNGIRTQTELRHLLDTIAQINAFRQV